MPRVYGYKADGPVLQIVGLPRSGTTWMQDLLIANFDCGVVISNKHKMPHRFKKADNAIFVLMKKRFHHWIESIENWSNIFIEKRQMAKDVCPYMLEPDSSIHLPTIYEVYYEAWSNQQDRKVLMLNYHDALGDIDGVLSQIAIDYDVPTRLDNWDLLDTYHAEHPKRIKYLEGTKWAA